jgi:hypothetical protein
MFKPAMALNNAPLKIQIPTYQKMLLREETGSLYEAFIEDIPLCFLITKRDALRSYLIN